MRRARFVKSEKYKRAQNGRHRVPVMQLYMKEFLLALSLLRCLLFGFPIFVNETVLGRAFNKKLLRIAE